MAPIRTWHLFWHSHGGSDFLSGSDCTHSIGGQSLPLLLCPVRCYHVDMETSKTAKANVAKNSAEETGDDMSMFDCFDCGENTHYLNEYYMVTNTLWAEYFPERCGMLCIGCLESRMGRNLVAKDFPGHILINIPNADPAFWPSQSERLYARLTAQ